MAEEAEEEITTATAPVQSVEKTARKHIRNVSGALDRATKQVTAPLVKIKERTGGTLTPKPSTDSGSTSGVSDGQLQQQKRQRSQNDNGMPAVSPTVLKAKPDAAGAVTSSLPVLPDEAIKSMDVFVNETLHDVTVQEYYDKIWSETDPSQQFYAPWLSKNGKTKILVSDWEIGDANQGYASPLDGETYHQKRMATFVTKRNGIGPPTAEVTQTHLCRVEGGDKCVVNIAINMKVPFGDSFSVSVRWVATRVGVSDLSVQCGMQIVFHRQLAQ